MLSKSHYKPKEVVEILPRPLTTIESLKCNINLYSFFGALVVINVN